MRSSIAGELPNRNFVPPNFSKFYGNVKVPSSKVVARGPLMSLWMTTLPLLCRSRARSAAPSEQGAGEGGGRSRHQEAGSPRLPTAGMACECVWEHLSLWSVPEPHISMKNQQASVRQRIPPQPKPKGVLKARTHNPFLSLLGMSEEALFPGPKRHCHAEESLLLLLHLSYTMFFT